MRASTFLRGRDPAVRTQAEGPLSTGLLSGETVGALAYSETRRHRHTGHRRRSEDNGTWLLSGTKDIVVNAPMADLFVVLAWHDRPAGPIRMSLFLVEKKASVSASTTGSNDGPEGPPLASVTLDGCAWAGFGDAITRGRPDEAPRYHGCCRDGCVERRHRDRLQEIATAHAKARVAFGRKIGMFQDVGFKLADMFACNDLGRMLALRAAWGFNTGDREADILASCAKLFAGEAATKIVNWGMQIFAGHGYLAGTDMERLYRDAKFGEICERTSEMLRQEISQQELDRFVTA